MMLNIRLPLVCFLMAASPATAGPLDFLKGRPSVDCAVTDRPCLLAATSAQIWENAYGREHESNTAPYANKLAKLYYLVPEAERTGFVASIEEQADHPSFMKNFNLYLDRYAPPAQVPIDVLRTVLETEETPDGSKFGDFILTSFQGLLAGDTPQAALDLWAEKSEILWQKGGRAYRAAEHWLARNRPFDYASRLQTKYMNGRHLQRSWESIGIIADTHCQSGRIDEGNAVLDAALEQFDIYDSKDPVIAMYSRSELFSAVLSCQGEAKARLFLDDVMAMKPGAYTFIKDKYPEEREQAFVLSAAHDTVELRTTRALATWLYSEKDDKAAAKEVFDRGQATVGVWGLTANATGDAAITGMQREPMRFDTFERSTVTAQIYNPVPGKVLTYFLNDYARGEGSFNVKDDLKRFIQAVFDDWPSDKAQSAAPRILELAATGSKPQSAAYLTDFTLLRLAALPQPARCALSEARLQELLTNLPDYRFGDQRSIVLLEYLAYLDRLGNDAPHTTPCALPALMQ